MGGAFEAPWAGRIWGVAQPGGRLSESWRGHAVTLPAAGSVASGGLLLAAPAGSSGTAPLPDGGQTQAVFPAGDFGAHWPSKTEVTVSVLLSSHTIELTVTARNAGDVAEPVGIGWRPRFAIAKADRERLLLRIPGEMREEIRERNGGAPTGELLPVAGTPYDFTRAGGAPLGTMGLDDGFTSLHQEMVEAGPIVQLSDPASGYGLRMTVLSPAIKTIHVLAPADADFVSIDPQFNYDDPFGREWSRQPDTGMVVIAPGQSTQWKVRLEIVPLTPGQPTM
jgi:galactose mutarotase-like enzyme